MTSLQKKRDQFRFQIRKQKITKYMEQQRKKLLQAQKQSNPNQNPDLYSFTKDNIDKIIVFLQKNCYDQAQQALQLFQQKLLQNTDDIYFVLNNVKELSEFYFRFFTNKKLQPYQIIQQTLIKNNQWDEINKHSFKLFIKECLQFFANINFSKIKKSVHFKIIDTIWNIFNHNSQYGIINTKINQQQAMSSYQLFLMIIRNSLQIKIHEVFEKYQSIGLTHQLQSIVQSTEYNPMTFKILVLQILSLHFNYQYESQKNVGQIHNQLGISIDGSIAFMRQKCLLYSIYFIDRKQASQYFKVLTIIQSILSLQPHLTQKIKVQYYKFIGQQVLDFQDADLSNLALDLLNDIIYYSQETTKDLLEKSFILDILLKKLINEKQNYNNQKSKKAIDNCHYILCNCLYAKDTSARKYKKIIFEHPIWQLIYQSFNDQSVLFSMTMCYEYYFNRMKNDEKIKYLQTFLYALSSIDLQNSPHKNVCNKLIEIVQIIAEDIKLFHNDKYCQILKTMLQQYKMDCYVDFMDEEIQ